MSARLTDVKSNLTQLEMLIDHRVSQEFPGAEFRVSSLGRGIFGLEWGDSRAPAETIAKRIESWFPGAEVRVTKQVEGATAEVIQPGTSYRRSAGNGYGGGYGGGYNRRQALASQPASASALGSTVRNSIIAFVVTFIVTFTLLVAFGALIPR